MFFAERLVNMPTRARRFTSQASVGMFASRIPSSQLSKNDSFSTVKKRPVLHYTCAGRPICASFAPLGVYIYAFGGESCTTRHPLLRSARRWPRPWPRLAPSGVRRGARGLGLSPAPCAAAPVVFAAIRAAILRRRIRLLALRRVSPRIRRTASSHVAQFGTRPLVPCLTFHKARFSSHLLRRRGKSAAPP